MIIGWGLQSNSILKRKLLSPPSAFSLQGQSEFQYCLDASNLFDLSGRGCFFTWTNRSPQNPIARKLDRAIINEKWMLSFPDSNAYFDAPGGSDHSPCLISLCGFSYRRKTPFKFNSFLSSHPSYYLRLGRELLLLAAVWPPPIVGSVHQRSVARLSTWSPLEIFKPKLKKFFKLLKLFKNRFLFLLLNTYLKKKR